MPANRLQAWGRPRPAGVAAALLLAAGFCSGPASAQGFFDSFRASSERQYTARSYAPPDRYQEPSYYQRSYEDRFGEDHRYQPERSWGEPRGPERAPTEGRANPRATVTAPRPRITVTTSSGSGSTAYCVRLCDGRYFPLPRDGAASSADLCNSFCPASKTKVFTGGEIDNAVASDGSRYGGLANAFAYRARVVADCTCNGKDAFGLARIDVKNDPTLQPGDVVATAKGLLAYNGGSAKKSERNFTPVGSYAGLGRDLRKALANLKVSPDTMAADTAAKATSRGAGAKVSDGKRRAQLDR